MLPVIAAIGGMVIPASIYAMMNLMSPETMRGWAIPGATDIAFALAVMSLLGSRVPMALKVLLTAIAIIDDLGAILIIAAFYSDNLHVYVLLFAILPITGLFLLNRAGYMHRGAYIVLGIILWLAVLKSGVHATMAGVLTALFIPVRVADDQRSPARRLEHDLHPWVTFLILPLFGFANAGVSFEGVKPSVLMEPVTLGIIMGLFFGKQMGVFGAGYLAIKSGLCARPENTSWSQIYGVALLCGIGFTMSLFIGGLAFNDAGSQVTVRLGVLAGSILSAVTGYMVLRSTTEKG
jgi:NhaA family Na+:H+ antiporter